jgi:hypothetical protein
VQKCDEAGAKLVLVGDSKQLQAIEAGAAMRAVGEKVGQTEMSDVRRQKNEIDKEIARDFREGKAGDALEKMDAKGTLHVEKNMHEAKAAAVDGFLADKAEGKSSILIAATRQEVKDLNSEVRNRLIESGAVKAEGITAKCENGYRDFAVGDKVVFGKREELGNRGDKQAQVINGSTGTVTATYKNDGNPQISVKLDKSGAHVNVDFQEYKHLDHGYATTVHKSQGATVDTAHLLAGEHTGREFSYVAASRAREDTHLYTSKDFHQPRHHDENGRVVESDLAKSMSTSQTKDFASDYKEAGYGGGGKGGGEKAGGQLTREDSGAAKVAGSRDSTHIDTGKDSKTTGGRDFATDYAAGKGAGSDSKPAGRDFATDYAASGGKSDAPAPAQVQGRDGVGNEAKPARDFATDYAAAGRGTDKNGQDKQQLAKEDGAMSVDRKDSKAHSATQQIDDATRAQTRVAEKAADHIGVDKGEGGKSHTGTQAQAKQSTPEPTPTPAKAADTPTQTPDKSHPGKEK